MIGEPLVAGVPTTAVALDKAECTRLFPGGAELNVAVGLARLGVPCVYVGVVGDDPLGAILRRRLAEEGVDTSHVRRDSRPTGFYFREWLSDGERRPYYYRRGGAGAELDSSDVAFALESFSVVHLSGITPALAAGPRRAVEAVAAAASKTGVPVSFDANYRAALWSAATYRACVGSLLPLVDLLFLGEDEAEVLFGTTDPRHTIERARDEGVTQCVVRLGARGACGLGDDGALVARSSPATAVDPVGAGDAFDAGFLAAWLHAAVLDHCLELGVYCGARAVEVLGEHEGAPRRAELPHALATMLASEV